MVEDTKFAAVMLGTEEMNSGYQRKNPSFISFRGYEGVSVVCHRVVLCACCVQYLTDRLFALSASSLVRFIVP